MALYRHGFRRFTEDVDLLVTRDGLKSIHDHLSGLGYVPPFAGSKQLRDVENGVRIEFLVTGDFPGDGKPKPVAFPDPAEVGVDRDGISYINLPTLVELKLASGMTGGLHRLKDLADVIELIKVLGLPADFGDQLNPYVRDKYAEIWAGPPGADARALTPAGAWFPGFASSSGPLFSGSPENHRVAGPPARSNGETRGLLTGGDHEQGGRSGRRGPRGFGPDLRGGLGRRRERWRAARAIRRPG